MKAFAVLWSIASFLVQAAIVFGIPYVVVRGGRIILDRFAPMGFFEVPIVIGVARLLGFLLAGLLLAAHADAINLKLAFGAQSPWDLTTWQFLTVSANPWWSVNGLIGQIANHGIGALSGSLAASVGVLIVAVLLVPFAFWPPPASLHASLSAVCVAIITAYVTIYGVSLLFWLLFLLNFWMLVLLLVIFQWYRNRA